MSHSEQATTLVDAGAEDIRAVILDISRLAEWNPAFLQSSGPRRGAVGQSYPILVRPGLPGTFRYSSDGPEFIVTDWAVPGLHERGFWRLEPVGSRTRVTHGFAHEGHLGHLLRNAFHGVARLRLQRLSARATERRTLAAAASLVG